MNVIIARALPFLLIITSISPMNYTVDLNGLIGKEASWNFDTDIDGNWDTKIVVEDISTQSQTLSVTDLRCTITMKDLDTDGEVTFSNSYMEWNGIDLVIDDIDESEPFEVGGFAGASRQFVNRSADVNGTILTVLYDRDTGLLLEAKVDWMENVRYLRIETTNVFFNPTIITDLMIVVMLGIIAVTIFFIVYATIRDKRIRSRKACFEDGCW